MKKTLKKFCNHLKEYNLDVGDFEEHLVEEFLSENQIIDPFTEMVKQFHGKFKAPILDKPQIPDKERCELRVKLIQEELDELTQAIEDNDIVEIADALADIQYVLSGAYLEFGFENSIYDLVREVHRSNMSKACSNEQEAIDTVEYYKNERSTEGYYEKQEDGTYLVYRKGDNKVLKNINYSEANLEDIVNYALR
jgi:predicted HAD superfamily Cof-like phosphohydrolase